VSVNLLYQLDKILFLGVKRRGLDGFRGTDPSSQRSSGHDFAEKGFSLFQQNLINRDCEFHWDAVSFDVDLHLVSPLESLEKCNRSCDTV